MHCRLSSVGLAYSTEDDLRDEGQAVTPDVKLAVPISIDGCGERHRGSITLSHNRPSAVTAGPAFSQLFLVSSVSPAA
jgi:hypothetical protein